MRNAHSVPCRKQSDVVRNCTIQMNYTKIFVASATIAVLVVVGEQSELSKSGTNTSTYASVLELFSTESVTATSEIHDSSLESNANNKITDTSPKEKTKSQAELVDTIQSTTEDSPDDSAICKVTNLTEVKGEITVDYLNEDSCQEWVVQYGDGYNVDLTINQLELDTTSGDYLVISTDDKNVGDENSIVFTWKMKEKRHYTLPYKGTAHILFITYTSEQILSRIKSGGFHIIYSRSGELTTTEQPTTINPIPTPPPGNQESIIVYIEHNNFTEVEERFKNVMAQKANEFCNAENITIKTNVTHANVYLSEPTACQLSWAYSEMCRTMTMAIAVDVKSSTRYELQKQNLQKLWNSLGNIDFSELNIKKIERPNYKKHVIIWSVISVAFVALFSIFLFYVSRWQFRSTHRHLDSKVSTSAPLEVPPLFDYFDTRIDDPECLPYFDSVKQIGAEPFKDDTTFSFEKVPPLSPRANKIASSTFNFNSPNTTGIDNNSFIPEEDEEEYEIMNRVSLTKAAKDMDKARENKAHHQETNTES